MQRLWPTAVLLLALPACRDRAQSVVGGDWSGTPLSQREALLHKREVREERARNLAAFDAQRAKAAPQAGGVDTAAGKRAAAFANTVSGPTGVTPAARAEQLLALGRFQDALEEVQKALVAAPSSSRLLNVKGRALLLMNRPADAADAFAVAMAEHPTDSEALYGRARATLALGRAAEALEYINALRQAGNDSAPVLRLEAIIREARGDTHGALQALARADAQGDPFATIAQGNALAREGDVKGAVGALKAAAAKRPRDGTLQLQLGTALAEAGQLAEAEAALNKGATLLPTSPQAWRNLAAVRERQGDVDGAIKAWESLLKYAPQADAQGTVKDRVARLKAEAALP
ncbi:MAG: tetratricopeptide repeat protein [Myxococcales bacterium]|nr:tetratricopeptide repeat protein [Myxococcales bacterium]